MNFGGHPQAAGFSLDPQNFKAFQQALTACSAEFVSDEQLVESLWIDSALGSEHISLEFMQDYACLGPFGQENAEPLFYSSDLRVVDSRLVGDGRHLKLRLRDDTTKQLFDAIGFNLADKLQLLSAEKNHFLFHLSKNDWQSQTHIQLLLVDIK